MIDRQVAHLSVKRVVFADWQIPAYVRACCEALTLFFGEIRDADRRRDFAGIPEIVREVASNFGVDV